METMRWLTKQSCRTDVFGLRNACDDVGSGSPALRNICTALRNVCTGLRKVCIGLRKVCMGLRNACIGLRKHCIDP